MANSCIDCNSPEAIPQTEILYAQGEPSPRRLRRHIRLPEPQTGYALYHCDDEYETGFYIVAPQAANNLVSNPTFFIDLDGWSEFNASMVRTNEIAFDMGFSVKISGSGDQVTAERREYLETSTTAFIPGQPYTFSMYGWTPVLWDLSDPVSLTISIADDLGNEIFSEPISKAGKWERLVVSTVTDLNATELFLRINLRSQDQRENQPPFNLTGEFNLANEHAYFDMGQLEFGPEATTPFHGDTNTCASCDTTCGGYSWSGVDHKSPSTRDQCVRDGGKLVCLSDLGFEISSHTGHGMPPIRDISFPYNNRPGEFYQKSVADARVMTFTGQLCETTLKDLECAMNELMGDVAPGLGPCSCCGKFLLVYHHGECDENECDTERDLAICVTYIGGLEGIRTNHYLQQAAIQFKAHDPFWFEWPGHSSSALDFTKVITTPNLVSINSDGTVRGFPISGSNTYTSIACRPGLNSVAIGGEFTSIDGSDDRCEENVAIWDCDEWVDLCLGFAGGAVHDLTSDGSGNILVAGAFSGPCTHVAIIYEDGTTGCFSGYPGGEAFAIAAPFWAQVVVGDANGIYIQDFDGNWSTFATDGQVNGFTVDAAGNVYAVGDFTTVDGIETGSVAFFNVNATGCLDVSGGVWESLGFTFNAPATTLDINRETGEVYIGGQFTEATPLPVEICTDVNRTRVDSDGSDQQLQFRQIAGDNYEVEVYYSNVVARNQAFNCVNNGDYVRITGQSSFGTQYNLLFGDHNASIDSINTVVVGADTFYTIIYDVDIGIDLGDPCDTLNEGIVNELDTTRTDIETYASLPLPGGLGIDNTLNRLSAQCVEIRQSFQGDDILLNHVAQMSGGNLLPMGDGIDYDVNVIKVHPITGEVWAGTTNGLFIWNGLEWYDFAGMLGASDDTEVLDIEFCNDGCSTLILFNSASASALPGITSVNYRGDVNPTDFDLIVHGPGQIHSFKHNGSQNALRMCTVLECNEIATLSFVNGQFDSNHRSNLKTSILGGSRFDICLDSCKPNDISIYITDDDATTKATLLWRDAHKGIEALCCKSTVSSLQETDTAVSQTTEDCFVTDYLEYHRDPTDDDCRENGIEEGTLWHNALSGCGLFIATGDCEDCTEFEDSLVTEDGLSLTLADGTVICPEDTDCGDFT